MARRDKGAERQLAATRVDELCATADTWARDGHRDAADRAVDLARRLAERHKLGYPPALKQRMCRTCHRYIGGTAGRRRLTGGRLTVTCVACGAARRRPLAPRLDDTPSSPQAPG